MIPKARIGLVEDEVVVAMDIRAQLERLGYEVVSSARTASQGIAQARAERPDLVLMDIQLAGERDGISAAEEIRQSLAIPVVFLTAFADESSLERAKAVSPYGYIVKPLDEYDLETSIEVALSRARAEASLERSHADLMAVLDVQRQGSVAVDGEGRVSFLSQVAATMIDRPREEQLGRRWQEVLPLRRSTVDSLEEMLLRPAGRREKIAAELEADEGRRAVEIETVDDPRSEGRFILFLYDVSEVRQLRALLDRDSGFEKIIGTGKAMQAVFQLIRDLSAVDSPVLILGDTGTGKELVARAIHRLGHRQSKPFVPVNCGALTPELAASQLFGHRRGSFTGAIDDHRGLFRAANHGTLFLDEIGELPVSIQPALLRALDDGQITPVGETRAQAVDFRLVAATSRSLEHEIEQQIFRSDLYYRLAVAKIVLPPLRERLEDLPILVRSFLTEATARTGKSVTDVSSAAMALLLGHAWPGNVRELRNAVEFATIRARGSVIEPEDLAPELLLGTTPPPPVGDESMRISAALEQTGGNRRRAAELLGMSRATFYRRLKSLGLKP